MNTARIIRNFVSYILILVLVLGDSTSISAKIPSQTEVQQKSEAVIAADTTELTIKKGETYRFDATETVQLFYKGENCVADYVISGSVYPAIKMSVGYFHPFKGESLEITVKRGELTFDRLKPSVKTSKLTKEAIKKIILPQGTTCHIKGGDTLSIFNDVRILRCNYYADFHWSVINSSGKVIHEGDYNNDNERAWRGIWAPGTSQTIVVTKGIVVVAIRQSDYDKVVISGNYGSGDVTEDFMYNPLTINKTKQTIQVKDKVMLKVTNNIPYATPKITWSSSNTYIAKVNQKGEVTGVNKGKAIIYAENDRGEKVSCNITVEKKETALNITPSKVILYSGEAGKTINLNKTDLSISKTEYPLIWKSSNEKIVKVKKGSGIDSTKAVLTPQSKLGTTTITVTTKSGKKGTMTVEVRKRPESIVINTKSKTIYNDESSTSKLTATVYPYNAYDKTVKWTSSNKTVVAIEQDGTIKALKETGNKPVTITAKTTNNKTATCKVTVVKSRVTSVKFKNGSVEGNKGKTQKLEVEILPAQAKNAKLTWSSSNAAVAKVDGSGNVEFLGDNQEATITATSANGIKATCTVKSILARHIFYYNLAGWDISNAKEACYISSAAMVLYNLGYDVTPTDIYNVCGSINYSRGKVQNAYNVDIEKVVFEGNASVTYKEKKVKDVLENNPQGVMLRQDNYHTIVAHLDGMGNIVIDDPGKPNGYCINIADSLIRSWSNVTYYEIVNKKM